MVVKAIKRLCPERLRVQILDLLVILMVHGNPHTRVSWSDLIKHFVVLRNSRVVAVCSFACSVMSPSGCVRASGVMGLGVMLYFE